MGAGSIQCGGGDGRPRGAHNPEIAGSNPARATSRSFHLVFWGLLPVGLRKQFRRVYPPGTPTDIKNHLVFR